MKMCFGNGIGFRYDEALSMRDLFGYHYGSLILELAEPAEIGIPLGETIPERVISYHGGNLALSSLLGAYEAVLEPVYPCNIPQRDGKIPAFSYEGGSPAAPAVRTARPRVLIPVFPGTNCEYDSAKAFSDAGAEPEIFVVNNLTAAGISRSAERFAKKIAESEIIFIPGGFSGGDEPDGSGKFITAFFRNAGVREATGELLDRRAGLMAGICNGFQALIKLGLVPYGKIIDADETAPTLTYNVIGRHQSRLVRTRICSNLSPWLSEVRVGDIITVPISHGEGRFLASDAAVRALAERGQIATQYVDMDGNPTYDIRYNPNGSAFAVEGITSPDGRVFGKMGHSERVGSGLYRNVPGDFEIGMFRAAVKYFRS